MNRVIDKGFAITTKDGETWTCSDRSYSGTSAIFTNGTDLDVTFYDRTLEVSEDGYFANEPCGMPPKQTRHFNPSRYQADAFHEIVMMLRREKESYHD